MHAIAMGHSFRYVYVCILILEVVLCHACTTVGIVDSRLKVLCLHGFNGCKRSFGLQLTSIREATASFADFYFINAPYVINKNLIDVSAAGSEANDSKRLRYSWWYLNLNKESDSVTYAGLDKSLQLLAAMQQEQGPFDVVIAHSQGAALLLLLNLLTSSTVDGASTTYSTLTNLRDDDSKIPSILSEMYSLPSPSLSILLSGFTPRDSVIQSLLSQQASIKTKKSLHIFHQFDSVVPIIASIDAMKHYLHSESYQIDESSSHQPPRDEESIRKITDEMVLMYKEKHY